MTTMSAKKTRSPEYVAAFAVYHAANQALIFAEMDFQTAEAAYFDNNNHYSHGLRKGRAMRRKMEAAKDAVEVARVAADAALKALRAVKDAEALTA